LQVHDYWFYNELGDVETRLSGLEDMLAVVCILPRVSASRGRRPDSAILLFNSSGSSRSAYLTPDSEFAIINILHIGVLHFRFTLSSIKVFQMFLLVLACAAMQSFMVICQVPGLAHAEL
jgi:hypothetical protein